MGPSQGRVITRNRDRLVCTECHRRKLRCDRASPCSSCVRRGSAEACSYRKSNADGAQDDARLQRLEQLVQHLVANPDALKQSSPSAPATSAAPNAAGSSSRAGEPLYSGPTHWSAMLDDIQELRHTIALQDDEPDLEGGLGETSQPLDEGTGVIFGAVAALPLEAVLATYLPPRHEVDRLIAAYFRAQALAAPFIHSLQFQRLYGVFWADPLATPPLWTSMLFSICHIAVNALKMGATVTANTTDLRFATASAHCLAIGEYFRPKHLALQSLLLYAQSLCLTSTRLSPDLGSIFGVIIRLATAMGYHRESTNAGLTPFEQEIRRRTWSICLQLELLVSFHLGLPSAVPYASWDTQRPRNLYDSDFDEGSAELPAERPVLELTSMLFFNTKYSFMIIFERITRHALMAQPGPAQTAETDALDAEMRLAYAALPEFMRPRPLSESVVDSPSLIVSRLSLSALYCKCMCVLHRPYVARHRPESIVACYEASSRLVRDFADVCHEFGPDGQGTTEAWFLSSLTRHDFLLGTTALCLVALSSARMAMKPAEVDLPATMELLKKARDVCGENGVQRGKDTQRVHKLTNATIQWLERENIGLAAANGAIAFSEGARETAMEGLSWDYDPAQEAGVDTLWEERLQELLDLTDDSGTRYQ